MTEEERESIAKKKELTLLLPEQMVRNQGRVLQLNAKSRRGANADAREDNKQDCELKARTKCKKNYKASGPIDWFRNLEIYSTLELRFY